MAGVLKRRSDKARGMNGKWTGWYYRADGRRAYFAGSTDRAATLRIAQAHEAEQGLVRAGVVEPRDLAARQAAGRPLAEHIEDYRQHLLAKGGTPRHAQHIAATIRRLLEQVSIASITAIRADLVQAAVGRLVSAGRSARTANHALAAARAFTRWLTLTDRLREDPLKALTARQSETADPRYTRRDLSADELARLIEAAWSGPAYIARYPRKSRHLATWISGPDRAIAYLIAATTGLRAGELRSLTPESFTLAGDDPRVRVRASCTKNGQTADQPIPLEVARRLAAWLETKPAGQPVLNLPARTAQMLRCDLARAGIDWKGHVAEQRQDGAIRRLREGVVDFHALRASYITRLVESGANPRTAQALARHSSVTLTLGRYTKTDDARKRAAVEGLKTG